MLKAVIVSMRPQQWTKNLIVFAGLVFSRNLLNYPLLARTGEVFLLFCLLSSSIYIINDVADREQDENHPVKRRRPIASGQLNVLPALTFASILGAGSIIISFCLRISLGWTALSYFLLLGAYSLLLKHIVIVDVLIVSLGFVLRAVAGAVAIDVEISPWLVVCTILLALFLVLCKRRHELVFLNEEAHRHRPSLAQYNPPLLDQMISVVTASTVIAYCLYTFSERTIREFGTTNLKYTIPFVLYGIFRYLYLVHQKEGGGSPEKTLLSDKPLIFNLVLWGLTVAVILYLS